MSKKRFGLIFVIMSLTGLSAPVKSMLGADGSEIVAEDYNYTVEDYIQDGLIGIWDAIENVGVGVHDASATKWVDLTGTHSSFSLASTMHWEDNALVGHAENRAVLMTGLANKYPHSNGPCTIEQVGVFGEGLSCKGFAIAQIRSNGDSEASVSAGTIASFPNTSRNFENYGIGMQFYFPWASGLTFEKRGLSGLIDYTMTCDGVTFSIYKEGFLKYSNRQCGKWSWTNSVLHILWTINGGTVGTENYIHCIRIYDRELSAEEVLHNNIVDRVRFGL